MILIVLAAGYASRMYPLTEHFPKPLLPVQDKPILSWLMDDIGRIDAIERAIIVSNHRFIRHFEDWKVNQHFPKPVDILDDGSTTNETRAGAVQDILIALKSLKSLGAGCVYRSRRQPCGVFISRVHRLL